MKVNTITRLMALGLFCCFTLVMAKDKDMVPRLETVKKDNSSYELVELESDRLLHDQRYEEVCVEEKRLNILREKKAGEPRITNEKHVFITKLQQ